MELNTLILHIPPLNMTKQTEGKGVKSETTK